MRPVKMPQNTEGAELCDAHGENVRVTCDRLKGHAKSQQPDDWHEGRATHTTRTSANTFEHSMHQTDVMRWRPNALEVLADTDRET